MLTNIQLITLKLSSMSDVFVSSASPMALAPSSLILFVMGKNWTEVLMRRCRKKFKIKLGKWRVCFQRFSDGLSSVVSDAVYGKKVENARLMCYVFVLRLSSVSDALVFSASPMALVPSFPILLYKPSLENYKDVTQRVYFKIKFSKWCVCFQPFCYDTGFFTSNFIIFFST